MMPEGTQPTSGAPVSVPAPEADEVMAAVQRVTGFVKAIETTAVEEPPSSG